MLKIGERLYYKKRYSYYIIEDIVKAKVGDTWEESALYRNEDTGEKFVRNLEELSKHQGFSRANKPTFWEGLKEIFNLASEYKLEVQIRPKEFIRTYRLDSFVGLRDRYKDLMDKHSKAEIYSIEAYRVMALKSEPINLLKMKIR